MQQRKVDICGLQKVEAREAKAFYLSQTKKTSYGGQKIMLGKVVWEY